MQTVERASTTGEASYPNAGNEVSVVRDVPQENMERRTGPLGFDMSEGAKFACRKHKQPHGPNLYAGFLKKPILTAEGSKRFVAVILQNKKEGGRKRRFPMRRETFASEREARETGLLWACDLRGIGTDHLTPGHVPVPERRRLLAELGQRRQLITLMGPKPHFLETAYPARQEEEPAEAEATLPEADGVENASSNLGTEAAQMPEPATVVQEQHIAENLTITPKRSAAARVLALFARVRRSLLALIGRAQNASWARGGDA